jgi:3-oxoacyl-[acyl-carrier-protein] synthase III
MNRAVGIVGLGSAIPQKVMTNADLEKIVDTTDEWITSRTGIRERRIADDDVATSDLGAEAALKALKAANMTPEEVDLIVLATVSPDMIFPASACFVQAKIGASNAAAFDLSAGCSGFIYSLAVASQMIATGLYNNALVIGAEVMSKMLNWQDRNTCVLFGDAAGAAVLKPVSDGSGFLSFYLGADGTGAELLAFPGGGTRHPATEETLRDGLHGIHMAGSEVFKFAVRIMGEASLVALEKAGLTGDDVDLLIPHQANTRIIEAAMRRLKLPQEKVYINLDRFGNTSAASVAVALEECVEQGRVKSGDNILMVGFGAGLTWGATVLRWV